MLAGGQSLIPVLKLRFAAPGALVDINRIEGLDTHRGGRRMSDASARSSATRRASAPSSCRAATASLGDAAPQISDPIVRNLGTVGGSLAHADPQGDWGSALLAAGAEVEARGPSGTRSIPLDELFVGPFTTTLEPNEIVTEVRVPDPGRRAGGTYLKLERKVGDFATVGVAVHAVVRQRHGRARRHRADRRRADEPAARPRPRRRSPAPRSTTRRSATAAELAAEAAQPRDDNRGSAEYKRNVVRVFTERGLRKAAETARS